MEDTFMNAQQADEILDTCSGVFDSVAATYGLHLNRNDHFEGVNRVLKWTDGPLLKAIAVEFTYSEKPSFEITIKAFNRIELLLCRYGGVLRHAIPLRQWYRRYAQVELPQDVEHLESLIKNAYQELRCIGTSSLRA